MNISQPLNPQPKRSPSRVLGLFLACVVALFAAVPEAQAQACDIATDGANSGFGASLESCTESIEGGNNVQAITIPTPAGINPGDLLIVSINIDDAPAMNLPPTDWQEVDIVQAGGGAATLAVYSKFVVGGEDASYTFGWSGGNQEAVGIMLHFSGVTGNYQFATDSGTGTPGTPLGPGVDTNGNSNPLNNLILRLVTYDDDDLADGQNPLVDANHSRINFDSSGGGGASVQGGAAYQFQGVAGDTGGVTFPDGNEQWATMSIALEPRPSPACTVPSVGSGVYVVYESCEEAKDTGVTSISLNTPAGVAANDLLIAVVSVDEDVSTTIAAPAGWTALTETASAGAVTLGVYSRIATGTEVGPYDFTWTGAQDVVSYMLHFSNVDTGTPPPYVVSSPATGTGGVGEEAPVAPVVTTISPNNLILRIAAWDGAGQTPDPATIIIGHSNINQDESANAAGAVSSGAAYEQQPSTGPSATASFQTVNEEWVALSIAIEPPPGVVPPDPLCPSVNGLVVGNQLVVVEECTEAREPDDTASISISTPATTQDGDLLLAVINSDNDIAITDLSAAWTLVDQGFVANSSPTLAIYSKFASGDDIGGGRNYTFENSSGGEEMYAYMLRLTGASGTILDAQFTDGNDDPAFAPGLVDTGADNSLVVHLIALDDADITPDPAVVVSGFRNITYDYSSTGGGSVSAGAVFISQDTAGNTAPNAGFDNSGDTESFRSATLAIQPLEFAFGVEDGVLSLCSRELITIRAVNRAGQTLTSFRGTVSISTNNGTGPLSGTGTWAESVSNPLANAISFDNGVGGSTSNGQASYAFAAGDNGSITLEYTTGTLEDVNFDLEYVRGVRTFTESQLALADGFSTNPDPDLSVNNDCEFRITHDGIGGTCGIEPITITLVDSVGNQAFNYIGETVDVTLSSGAGGIFSTAAAGALVPDPDTDGGANGNGSVSYTFTAADNGQVVLNYINGVAGTVNFNAQDASSGYITDTDSPGLYDPNLNLVACKIVIDIADPGNQSDVCSLAQITFTVADPSGTGLAGFTGVLNISNTPAAGNWSGSGVVNGTANDGIATYTFDGSETGGAITLGFSQTTASAAVNFNASVTASNGIVVTDSLTAGEDPDLEIVNCTAIVSLDENFTNVCSQAVPVTVTVRNKDGGVPDGTIGTILLTADYPGPNFGDFTDPLNLPGTFSGGGSGIATYLFDGSEVGGVAEFAYQTTQTGSLTITASSTYIDFDAGGSSNQDQTVYDCEFRISFDGGATGDAGVSDQCSVQEMTISVFNTNNAPVTNYLGTVSLDADNGGWAKTVTPTDAEGDLTDDFLQDGIATYEFVAGDLGSVTLNFSTVTAGNWNFSVDDGNFSASNPAWNPNLLVDVCTFQFEFELGDAMSVCSSEVITLRIVNSQGTPAVGYQGLVTLSNSIFSGDWATTASGIFTPGAADSGSATYTFDGTEANAEVFFTFTNDSVESAVDFDVISAAGSIVEEGGVFDPVLEITGCIPSQVAYQCFPGSDNGGTGQGNYSMIQGDDAGRLLVMAVFHIGTSTVATATYGGVGLDYMGRVSDSGNSDASIELWGVLNDDITSGNLNAATPYAAGYSWNAPAPAANSPSMCMIELSDVEQALPLLGATPTSSDPINISAGPQNTAPAQLTTAITTTANNALMLSVGLTDRDAGGGNSWFNAVAPSPPMEQLLFGDNNQNPDGGTGGGSIGTKPISGLFTITDQDTQAAASGYAHIVASFNSRAAGAPEADGYVPVVLFETLSGNLSYRAIGHSNRKSRNNTDGSGGCNFDDPVNGYSAVNSGSTAQLTLPSANSVVEKAYLYWVGSGDVTQGTDDPDVNFGIQGALVSRTADEMFYISGVGGNNNLEYFAGYKDVTNFVTGDGLYELNGLTVQAGGSWADQACAGGWALVVVYSDPAERFRVVNLFHGLQSFQNSAFTLVPRNFRMQTTDYDGLDVGPYYVPNGQITHVTIEGDEQAVLSSDNEYLGVQAGPNPPLSEIFNEINNSFNPPGGDFNSTVSQPVYALDGTTGKFEFQSGAGINGDGYAIFGPGPDAVGPTGPNIGDSYGFDIDTNYIDGSTPNGVLYEFAQPGLEAEAITTEYSSGQDLVLLVSEVISITNFDIADLEVFKTLSGTPGEFTVGGTGEYVYTVTNNGNGTTIDGEATGRVVIADTLPSGLTLTGMTANGWTCTTSTNAFTCEYNIGNGIGSGDCTIALCGADYELLRLQSLPILRASITVGGTGDFPLLDNSVKNIVRIQANDGSCAGGFVAGVIPDPLDCDRAPQFDNINDLDGGSIDVNDLNSKTTENNNVDSIVHNIRGIETDLRIIKAADGILEVGGSQTYTITVTNLGPRPTTTDFTVQDNEPAGIDFTSVAGAGITAGDWSCAGDVTSTNLVDCDFTGTLGVGASAQLTLGVNIVGTAGLNVTNTAQVTAGPFNFDTNLSNNTSSDTRKIVAPPVASQERFLISTSVSTNDTNIGTNGVGPFENDDYFIFDPLTDEEERFYDDSAAGDVDDVIGDVDDANAVHLFKNGHIAISAGGTNTSDGSSTLGEGAGQLTFGPEDVIDYDPILKVTTTLFDGSAIFDDAGENIDAVYVRDNGNILFSTVGPASITYGGGPTTLNFDEGDIVEYDPSDGSASILFDSEDDSLFGAVVQISGIYQRVSDGDDRLTKDVFVLTVNQANSNVGDCATCDPGSGTSLTRDDIVEVDLQGLNPPATTETQNLFLGDVIQGVFTTAGTDLEIDALHVIEDGYFGHFAISQSQQGSTCEAGQYTIAKHRGLSHDVDTDYTGSISISTSTGGGIWSIAVGTNPLLLAGLDNGIAQYTFDPADNGQVTLYLAETDASSININVTNGFVKERSPDEDPNFSFSNVITTVSYRDEFNAALFSNNDGSTLWNGDWIEVDDENDTAIINMILTEINQESSGNITVDTGKASFTSTPATTNNPSLTRSVDLTLYNVTETVVLNFDYSYQFLNDPGDEFIVEVSPDASIASPVWTEVFSWTTAGTQLVPQPSGDIPLPQISGTNGTANSAVRFRINSGYTGTSLFFVDNIQLTTGTADCGIGSFNHYAIEIDGRTGPSTGPTPEIVPGISCLRSEIAVFGHDANNFPAEPFETVTLRALDEAMVTRGTWNAPHVGTGIFNETGSLTDGVATYTFPSGEVVAKFYYNYTNVNLTNDNFEDINFDIISSSPVQADEDPILRMSPVVLRMYNDTADGANSIPAQISGKASNVPAPNADTLTLQVLTTTPDNPEACVPFIQPGETFNFSFALECIDSDQCNSNGLTAPVATITTTSVTPNDTTTEIVNLDSNGGTNATVYTDNIPMTFASYSNAGTAAEFVINYQDAGNVQLHASLDIPLDNDENNTGIGAGEPLFASSNVFTVRPFGIGIDFSAGRSLNGTDDVSYAEGASGPGDDVFAVAGVGFNTTVRGIQYQPGDDLPDGPGDTLIDGLPDGIPDTDAVLWDNLITPNFGNDSQSVTGYKVRVNSTTVAPPGPGPSFVGLGALTDNDFSFSDTRLGPLGGFREHTMTFDEVGIIDLEATLVDNGNAETTYLNSGSTLKGFVTNVGRFRPAYLEFVSGSILSRVDASMESACVAPSNPFTYLGEEFQINGFVEAKNASDVITRNYVDDFAKLDSSDLGESAFYAFVAGADDDRSSRLALGSPVPDVTWPANTADLADRGSGLLSGNLIFNRQASGAPDGPFTAGTTEISIGLSTADSDTAAIKLDTNLGVAPADSEDDVALIATEEFRYGRLRLLDSFGPETEPLGIGVLAEYWNGSEFIVNTDDSCTTLPFSFTPLATDRLLSVVPDSALAPLEGSPIATDDVAVEGGSGTDFKITLSGGETVANDIGSVDENDANEVLLDSDRPFIAGPPTGETVGSVILELDLDSIFDFLKYDWRGGAPDPGATALDILYDDVPEEASGEYNDNPRAIIEFGSYRGHDRVINWQEILIGPTP